MVEGFKNNLPNSGTEWLSTQDSMIRSDGGTIIDTKTEESIDKPCQISVQNLGGIDSLESEIQPGISLLVGRNATNRTSLLRSIAAGLGGYQSAARLKTDSGSGAVELTIDGENYSRKFTRNGRTVTKGGEP